MTEGSISPFCAVSFHTNSNPGQPRLMAKWSLNGILLWLEINFNIYPLHYELENKQCCDG